MSNAHRERPGNYDEQARTYDRTRGASPTVLRAITGAIGPAAGRSLLDLAGGTGNYSQALMARGYRVTVVDANASMLANADRKLGPGHVVRADVAALPFGGRSFDTAVMVNAMHLLDDPLAALRQAKRVLRGGPLAVTAFTKENLAALFVYGYFGLEHPITPRPPAAEVLAQFREAGFSDVTAEPYVYTDTADGSLNALHTNAMHLAGPAYLRNTSFWHRLDEETRRTGLEALARDLRSGVLERRVHEAYRTAATTGHGTLFTAWP